MGSLISSASSFEQDIGHSRAVVGDDWVFVSGTTGFDYKAMTISEDVIQQQNSRFATLRPPWRKLGAASPM